MAAHAGENARETGDFVCETCRNQVHVSKGEKIPKCPECGSARYADRYHEPGNKKSS